MRLSFVLRRGLRHEIVHAGFGGDGGGGQRIVAGDHHGADAHLAQLREALLDAAFDHVLELNDAEHFACLPPRRAACRRRARFRPRSCATVCGKDAALLLDVSAHGVGRALANGTCGWPSSREVHAAHARLRGERNERGVRLVRLRGARRLNFSLASTTMLRPSGVSSASEASCAASASRSRLDARRGQERRGHAVAEGDRAGLVEQQHVDVAGGFHRAAARRHDIAADQAVHAADADGAQQSADGRRNQADQQRDQHRDRESRGRSRCRTASASRTTSRKMNVSADSRIVSAISFGVFWRLRAFDHARSCGRGSRVALLRW